ncbi:MAG: hypothetical protein Q4F57_02190 [Weeksellaceae bacterium]|nr:hypothetical protein [Weeksellaceae bacterium]
MKKSLFLSIILLSITVFGQKRNAEKVLQEGKQLYRTEKASWFATDHMLSNFAWRSVSFGGYVSYQGSDNNMHTVFFNKGLPHDILLSYKFHHLPQEHPISIDTTRRPATKFESDLIEISMDARTRVLEDEESFFNYYQNTSFNFVPLITKNEKKVFILTAPQKSGVVLLGNDYLLQYGRSNKFQGKSKIHNSLIQLPYHSGNEESKIETTIHSHVLDDLISSTDICTLLLYKDFADWNQHIVISKDLVSILTLDTETLFTMKRKDWEKISKSQ